MVERLTLNQDVAGSIPARPTTFRVFTRKQSHVTPPAMLRIENLTYRIGPRILLDQAKAVINPGHRVGFIGRNGVGKTTLFRLITGELEPDDGETYVPERWQIGQTSQDLPEGTDNLLEIVIAADKELAHLNARAEVETDPDKISEIHERLQDKWAYTAHSRAAKILAGLGFSEHDQTQPCNSFSGGWRMRVALASLLFTEPDLLLLDEPTNHLDLEASLWLEDYLTQYQGTLLLISHDRDLLNRVVGEILHLEHGKLTLYQGGYDRFEATRRMRLDLQAKQRVKQDLQRAHIQKFVDRFRYSASKAKQAQSRIKMLAKMEPIPEDREGGSVHFNFPDPGHLPPPLYSMDQVSIGYDDKVVLSNLSPYIGSEDRIALLGANGHGKSTLIKLLAGRLSAMEGNVSKSSKLKIGYFAQHQADELDLDATPVIELGRRRPKDLEEKIRAHLGRYGFSQERGETKVGNLSGGEKARLLFALMTADAPHILLLDEPTNHLDVDSRQALIQAINMFPGAVVIVSHDFHILELTTDQLWLVDGGTVAPFDGDLSDYRSFLLKKPGRTSRENKPSKEPKQSKKERRKLAAEKRKSHAHLKKKLSETEALIDRLNHDIKDLNAQMADPELYQEDAGKLVALQKKLGEVTRQVEDAEERWATQQADWDQKTKV